MIMCKDHSVRGDKANACHSMPATSQWGNASCMLVHAEHSIDSAEGLLSKSYIMLSAHATVFGKHKTNDKSTSKSNTKLAERVSRISICGYISSVGSSCVVYSQASYRCDVLNLPDSIELGTLSLFVVCVCVCL